MIQLRAFLAFVFLFLFSSGLWAQDGEFERRKSECMFKAQFMGYSLKARQDACSDVKLLEQRSLFGDYPLVALEDFQRASCNQELATVRASYNLYYTQQNETVFAHILNSMYYCDLSFFDVNRYVVTQVMTEIMRSSGKSLEDLRAEELAYHQRIREHLLNFPKDSAEYQSAEDQVAQGLMTCEKRLEFSQRVKLTWDGFVWAEPLSEQQVDINKETCQIEFIEFIEGKRERLAYAGQ